MPIQKALIAKGKLLGEGLLAAFQAVLVDAFGTLDAGLDETSENLDDNAALFGLDRSDRAAANRRRDLLERKSRHVYPLFVELKHSDGPERHIDNPRCGAIVPSDLT